jgi:hypothetical protein
MEAMMLKFFSLSAALLAMHRSVRPAGSGSDECIAWRRDPLLHPALRSMSQRELADLPIGHPLLAGGMEALRC